MKTIPVEVFSGRRMQPCAAARARQLVHRGRAELHYVRGSLVARLKQSKALSKEVPL